MKRLSNIRLINWYHMEDATIPINGSALFMGDNGSGKSTILDAIQFALVADLTQVKFNQAANEHAARSLQGYTRWMTNTSGTKETHEFNRGDCTSFVLLEFLEPAPGRASPLPFVVGAIIDSFRDGRDPNRLHFIMNEASVHDVSIFRDNSRVPLSTAEFRQKHATRKGFFYSREPGPYRENLLTRLGKLSPDFTKILVKALAFKPLGQVHQFVMDFLLDERRLDTESLQANLANYKALEQKALEAERRIEQLNKISSCSQELARAREEILNHRYLEVRAKAGIQEETIASKGEELKKTESEKTGIIDELALRRAEQDRCEQALGSAWKALSESSGFLERERTKDRLEHAQAEKKQLEASIAEARTASEAIRAAAAELAAYAHLSPVLADNKSAKDSANGPDFFRALSEEAWAALQRTGIEISSLKEQGKALQEKLEGLKKGVRPYEKEVRTLKQLIEDEIGCQAPLLCELLEVSDEKWQAAIEGYLNTRRFDIVLDPKHFRQALSLYEKNKRQLAIHGVGLVDSEKVARSAPKAKTGSLAEIVASENHWAKTYADFILGDVIRCDTEQELRKHHRAITPTCMVYQNYAARQTPFHVYDTWYIGSRGRTRLIEMNQAALRKMAEELTSKAATYAQCEKFHALARSLELHAAKASALDGHLEHNEKLQTEIAHLAAHLATISTNEIEILERKVEALRSDKTELTNRIENLRVSEGQKIEKIKSLNEVIAFAIRERDRQLAELAIEFGSEERKRNLAGLNERYAEELKKKGAAAEVVRIFEAQRKNRETRVSNLLEELATLRTAYNNQFGFSAPVQGDDATPYSKELDSWKESRLPEYRQKIEKAKESALQQLMEDVVHKLRENLDLIPMQFDQINRALRGFSFGMDQYQFTHRIKKEFEPFEKLIREAALYERQPLFETSWKERFRDGGALEALFGSMTSGSNASVQQELQQFSDYRQYYEYDLKVLHPDGTHSMYSHVNRWKSGGETQTPYYIAVLASLYRMYRLKGEAAGKQRATIGLVILDEAFNKMDEDHLKATLEFTQRLGLQLIMATPKERAEFIIPHVESCWIVAKDPIDGRAFLLDYHQDLDTKTPDDLLEQEESLHVSKAELDAEPTRAP